MAFCLRQSSTRSFYGAEEINLRTDQKRPPMAAAPANLAREWPDSGRILPGKQPWRESLWLLAAQRSQK